MGIFLFLDQYPGIESEGGFYAIITLQTLFHTTLAKTTTLFWPHVKFLKILSYLIMVLSMMCNYKLIDWSLLEFSIEYLLFLGNWSYGRWNCREMGQSPHSAHSRQCLLNWLKWFKWDNDALSWDNDDLSSGAQNQCEASALSDCTVHHLVISGINLLSVCLIDHVCLWWSVE